MDLPFSVVDQFDNANTVQLQLDLLEARYRQLLRVSSAYAEEKNRQLFLSEIKVQEYEQRALKAEALLIDMGFKKRDDGVWVCQTPDRS